MPNVSSFRIDSLESRRMLSISHGDGFGDHDDGDHSGPGHDDGPQLVLPMLPALPAAPGVKTTADYATAQTDLAAAQAALTKVQADATKLQTDGATFATDRAALRTAVKTLLATPTAAIQGAENKLKADELPQQAGV